MSREDSALRVVESMIPDDEILDIALAYPRGYTQAQGMGGVAGSGIGLASGGKWTGVSTALGTVAGGKLFASLSHMPPSIVLALSPTKLYTFGRNSTALVGHWDHIVPMVVFDRDKLKVDVDGGMITTDLTLTDTEHNVSLDLELKRFGSMDWEAFAQKLNS